MKRRLRRIAPAAVLAAALLAWLRLGPLPAGVLDAPPTPSTVVVDRHGVPLYEALSSDDVRMLPIDADHLPPTLVAATVAAEDRRFFAHPGVDPVAIVRAALHDLLARRFVEGGSTITQQIAKLLLDRAAGAPRARGFAAKAREAVIALRLEHRLTKRQLLAMYLNLAAYGNQYVGAERASRGYFGVSTDMLTAAQAAFLAGLPQRPSGFNPYRSRGAAVARQHAVLRRMEAAGNLTAAQTRDALAERLVLAVHESPFAAPHFVAMVLDAAGGARTHRIETTLDAGLQSDVEGVIRSNREQLREHGAANVAVVVLDNASGEWLAWEGSGDYFDADHGGTINGPTVPRQPGSALKPFTYALAFDHGFSPASVLADVPSSFPTAEPGVVYQPRNYDGRYRGPMRARAALAGSENVPAVALASAVGVPPLLRLLTRSGVTTFDRTAAYYGLGVTLGDAEVRLDELVAAYSALARGGEWIQPSFLPRPAGAAAPAARRVVSPRAAFWVTDILSDPEAREFIFGRGGSLELPVPVAVKTGTSQAYHDNWTIGYSRRVTVGVWVGNFDRTPLRNSSGVTGAAPIFHGVMLAAERRLAGSGAAFSQAPILTPPPDTVERDICALSGMPASDACPVRLREWVPAGTPDVPCSWHHVGDEGLLTVWPPEYQQWARANGLRERAAPVRTVNVATRASRQAAHPAPAAAALTIVSPPDDATYLIDPTLRREFQAIPLRASGGSAVDWIVAGRAIGRADAGTALDWPLTPGRHTFVARDAHGHTATATITVR